MDSKKPWQSKTVWVALVSGILGVVGAFVPSIQGYLGEGGSNVLMVMSLVFGVLRVVTQGKISIE